MLSKESIQKKVDCDNVAHAHMAHTCEAVT